MNNITELVKNATIMTYALSSSSEAITDELTKLNGEKSAIESTMIDITSGLNTLLSNKESSLSGHLATFGKYGTQNAGEWVIETYSSITTPPVSASVPDAFHYNTDVSSLFSDYDSLMINNGVDGYSRCFVIDSTYADGYTTVTISGGEITSNIVEPLEISGTYAIGYKLLDNSSLVKDNVSYVATNSFSCSDEHDIPIGLTIETNVGDFLITDGDGTTYEVYPANLTSALSYVKVKEGGLWDDDTDISSYVSDFDFAYDYLNHPMGFTGTYGINAKISALGVGAGIIAANKSKQDLVDSVFRKYSEWTELPETPIYKDETSFYYPGDVTTTFAENEEILAYCGSTDREKTAKVNSSTYISPGLSEYTKVFVLVDAETYINNGTYELPLNENNLLLEDKITSISINSNSISGFSYYDEVSFLIEGDYTEIATDGSNIVVELNDEDYPVKYFKVYKTTLNTNTYAGYTLVKLKEGLPITENIENVSIVGD